MTPYYDDPVAGITIYHGDSREVMAGMADESVDLLWTDPPYGHSNHDGDLNSRLNEYREIDNRPIASDSPDAMRSVMDGALTHAARILKRDCCCCCCCCCCGGGPRPTFAWVANRMDTGGLSFFHSVIWDKINPGLGWRYRRQHEMVMVAHRTGGGMRWNEDVPATGNILRMTAPCDRVHPNEKPLALVSGFVSRHTLAGDLVLDPFMGSGTTLVAAKRLGRRAIGIEIEERYCAIAVERIERERLELFEAQPEQSALSLTS